MFLLQHKVDCVIHFAAMKAVGESMEYPMLYYKNNLVGMLNLLEVSKIHVRKFFYFYTAGTIKNGIKSFRFR